MGNRLPGGCVFGERSKTKTVERKTHRQKQNAQCCRGEACPRPKWCEKCIGISTGKKTSFRYIKTFPAPLGDEGKPRPYNVSVFWFWAIEIPVHVGDLVVGLRRRYSPRKPGGRLPTLRLPKRIGKCSPTRLGVPSKLVRLPNTLRRAGRPRSSPFPLRGKLSATPTLGGLVYQCFSCSIYEILYFRRS
ncbi:MAG: hypothetical protein LBQ66_09390 [Planctomycetaceae bacterium]|nr:hypothetical protein [Planctomycetaceae bacterium]